MASILHLSPIFVPTLLLQLLLLISPAHSLTCTSQKFNQTSTGYPNCTDLPSLKAYLHWAYDPTNSTLSIAFMAPPAKPDGWIAWGINPKSTGMLGAQALISLKDSNGSLVVKTYNLTSYKSIVETSKLWFNVVESKAEDSNGTMKIFATLALPENVTALNQVWQVGGSVKNGTPERHAFAPENLSSKGPLELVKAQSNATSSDNASGGGLVSRLKSGTWKSYTGVYGFLLCFGIFILGL